MYIDLCCALAQCCRISVRRTHCGLGAPQSMQRLFSLVFAISPSLDRVSGSTSHILLILGELRAYFGVLFEVGG